jgi:hypothetical protein
MVLVEALSTILPSANSSFPFLFPDRLLALPIPLDRTYGSCPRGRPSFLTGDTDGDGVILAVPANSACVRKLVIVFDWVFSRCEERALSVRPSEEGFVIR